MIDSYVNNPKPVLSTVPPRRSPDAASVSFNGNSRVSYDVSGDKQYVQTTKDRLKLRFRTSQANGMLFYADGNQVSPPITVFWAII